MRLTYGPNGELLEESSIQDAREYRYDRNRRLRAIQTRPWRRLILKGKEMTSEPTGELIEEHARLVKVLRSPSRSDDKREARTQGRELRKLKRKRRRRSQ